MSPELLDPGKFGLKKCRPTKESDCYALGMVVYEVLSGQTPFASSGAPVIIQRVLNGERPGRPEGNEGKHFTDGIWKMVQLCWIPQPRHRISAEAVLLGLEGKPISLRPSSNASGDAETDDDQSCTTVSDSGMFFPFHLRVIFDHIYALVGSSIARGCSRLQVPPGSSCGASPMLMV
jgi:hypothetical protein